MNTFISHALYCQHSTDKELSATDKVSADFVIKGCKNEAEIKKILLELSKEDDLSGLSVFYKGSLLISGAQSEKVEKVFSVSKSITALLAGKTLTPSNLDKKVSAEYPSLGNGYQDMSYRHLLSMTSGYDAKSGDYAWKEFPNGIKDNSKEPLVTIDPLFPPGSQYAYWTDGYRFLSHLIENKSKKPLKKLFSDDISPSLGIKEISWGGVQGLNSTKINDGGGGLKISSYDLGLIGVELSKIAKGAKSNIVSNEWFKEMTTVQVPAEKQLSPYCNPDYDGRGRYGLGWWLNTDKSWPSLSERSFAARGVHRNLLLVDPDKELIISRVNLNPSFPEKHADSKWVDKLSSQLLKALSGC